MSSKIQVLSNRVLKKIKGFRITRSVFAFPYILFLMLFVVVPLLILLVNAFVADGAITLRNFYDLIVDGASLKTLWFSLLVGFVTTVLCILIGYPVAYILSKRSAGRLIVLLFVLPMWVNCLIRTLATRALFESLNAEFGIGTLIFGMVYNYIPFMILPLHTTISNIDKSYSEAASDLGANSVTTFLKVNFPLSIPGLISGITMVFIPTISTFAISQFLGGTSSHLFGDSINTKFEHQLYGVGSVMSLIMLVLVLVSNFIISKVNKGETADNLW
ncbi:MAG: ABC transporter permease [Christensenellaceae bacterium]|jgi:spermidine/putrescine transport system permease protein|nr:ABC transporter permease [Christensenellaceae bacterium]